MAVPTAAIETVPIISLRVNPTQSSDWNSTLHPVPTSRFRSHYHVALLSCAVKSTHPYGNWNSRFFPCLSLSSYADICMARKDFVIVDQLSELLRAHIQPKRCQDSDSSQFLGFRCHSESPAFQIRSSWAQFCRVRRLWRRSSGSKGRRIIRAGLQCASRSVVQKFLAIFCRAGSAHTTEHPRKVLLRFESASHGHIQHSRLDPAHRVPTFRSA